MLFAIINTIVLPNCFEKMRMAPKSWLKNQEMNQLVWREHCRSALMKQQNLAKKIVVIIALYYYINIKLSVHCRRSKSENESKDGVIPLHLRR